MPSPNSVLVGIKVGATTTAITIAKGSSVYADTSEGLYFLMFREVDLSLNLLNGILTYPCCFVVSFYSRGVVPRGVSPSL